MPATALIPAPVVTVTRPEYICDRHESKGLLKFMSWKAYLRHCDASQEVPQAEPPKYVKNNMARFAYYCQMHNLGFKDKRLAERHIRMEARRPGRRFHVGLEAMKVLQVQTIGG